MPRFRPDCRDTGAAGFTILELMIVVAIIGIVMALAAPSVGSAMKEKKSTEAAYRVVSVYRIARSRALMRGLAHMVSWTPGTGGAGRFEVWESDQWSSCTRTTWGGLAADRQVMLLDLNTNDFTDVGVKVDSFTPSGGTSAQICYTPLGLMWYRSSGAGAWDDGSGIAGGGFDITIARYEGGALQGVNRHVMIPLGGMPRLRL